MNENTCKCTIKEPHTHLVHGKTFECEKGQKDIHINPHDDSTTIVQCATTCCGGHHQTIAGALLKSPQWKKWYAQEWGGAHHWDVDETQELDAMSDEHFQAFMKFCGDKK